VNPLPLLNGKEQETMAELTTTNQKDRVQESGRESTRGGTLFTPRVDIIETDKELLVFADVPGVRADDVDLRFENGELLLHGRVQPRQFEGTVLLGEYEEGDFYRVFAVHESIDTTRISAECKNGVLTVHLPKVEAAQPRQISVQAQ
jgi:HSP20 family molecular chaperone IbpA